MKYLFEKISLVYCLLRSHLHLSDVQCRTRIHRLVVVLWILIESTLNPAVRARSNMRFEVATALLVCIRITITCIFSFANRRAFTDFFDVIFRDVSQLEIHNACFR